MADEQQAWQELLDRAAYFNIIGVPNPRQASVPLPMPGQPRSLAGVHVHGIGHRFDVTVQPPHRERGVRAANVVGQTALTFSFRWLVIPHEFGAMPGREPPPTPFDASRTQRFAIMDGEFRWGANGEHRFTSIGAGRTFPLKLPGENTLRLAGVGAILEGSGQFQGLQGVYVISGFFTPPTDFRFNIFIRVNDLQGRLLTTAALPPLQPVPLNDRDLTYIHVYTRAQPETTTLTMAGEVPTGLHTWERAMPFHTNFGVQGQQGPKSQAEIGPVMGRHEVTLRLFGSPATPGTASSPIPFDDVETFYFTDADGQEIGSVTAPVLEGRSILMPVQGIPPQVGSQFFGGFASITKATGKFAGAQGIVTNVGMGTLAPHLTSIINIMELDDPTGKYRLG